MLGETIILVSLDWEHSKIKTFQNKLSFLKTKNKKL